MNKLLERAFAAASQLPEDAQDGLAQRFLDEIADEKRWDALFADSRSAGLLEKLAQEGLLQRINSPQQEAKSACAD